MPYEGNVSSFSDYLNTLGEIQGVIDANPHSEIFIVGDFNVDFQRTTPVTKLLTDFILELDIVFC